MQIYDETFIMPGIPDEITLKKAIIIYGDASQEDMAIEEMSELTKAICKLRRARTEGQRMKAKEDIAEETADVLITLAQLMIIHCNKDEVMKDIACKMSRLDERLRSGEART